MKITGFNIHVVPAGTEIENTAGDKLTVTETNAVRSGNKLYVTAENNKRIIEASCNAPFDASPLAGEKRGAE